MILKLNRTLNRIRRRFHKDDGGATAVEFAFVGAPFLFLMMATFETGLTLFSEYAVQSATTSASRLIRTGQAHSGGFSKAEFQNQLCAKLPAMLDCSKVYINVEVRNNFADASNRTDASDDGQLSDGVINGAAFDIGNAGDIVIVETFYEWNLFTPNLMKLLNIKGTGAPAPNWLANHGEDKHLVRGVAVFRNEPFD
uniref:Putative pilus assembly protein n=1 Tax=uncultured bacterium fosmid I5J7 TaxID=1701911 RepID=A0A1B0TH92_9BACT|nr:putative pilus assembly protein [uncultured bacterium fosmid I5J7]